MFFRLDYISDDIKRVERLVIFVYPDAEALRMAPQRKLIKICT
jgi:hypothetical protein